MNDIYNNILFIISFLVCVLCISYKFNYSFLFVFICIYIVSALIISYFISNHTHYEYKKYPFRKTSKIPHDIYTYWHNSTLSPLVHKCINSWKKHNPTYKIHIITEQNMKKYIPFPITVWKHAKTHQQISDCIRIYILSERGGIWIDASVYLNKPLHWIHSYQYYENSEMIGYQIGNQSPPMIENWFFAAIPKSNFLNDWKNKFYTMHDYDTISDYVDSIKVNMDSIPGDPHYLTMHMACLSIVSKPNTYRLSLLSAEKGPYLLVNKAGWNLLYLPILLMIFKGSESPLIKYRRGERTIIEYLGLTCFL